MTSLEIKNLVSKWVQYLLDKINNLVTSTLPTGGTTNQVLTKDSNADFDVSWQDPGASAGVSSLAASLPLNADTPSGDVTISIPAATSSQDGYATSTQIGKLDGIEAGADVTDAGNVGSVINASTAKNPPVDGDKIAIYDSVGSSIKHVLFSVAKTFFQSGLVPTSRTVNSKALSSNITLTQDDVGDGTTYKQYSDTEKTKLSGVESGADVTDIGNVSSVLNGASAETPVDADKFPFVDATDSTAKTVTGTNLKTYLGVTELGVQIHAKGAETPVDADEFVFSDTSDTNAGKKVTGANLKVYLGAGEIGATVHGLSAETPADADEFVFSDATASNVGKKVTGANLKTYIGVSPPGITASQTITDNTSINRPYASKVYIINSSTAKTLTFADTPLTADNGVVIWVTRAETNKAHAVQLNPDVGLNGIGTSSLFTFATLSAPNAILCLMPYEGVWYGLVSSAIGGLGGAWS